MGLVAVVVVAVAVAQLADPDPRAEAARHDAARRAQAARHRPGTLPATVLTIGAAAHARVIRPGFLGLSLEYSTIIPYAGSNPTALDPVFAQLIRNLSPGQRPQLRIGGDSTDWAWWPTSSVRRPPGIRIDLTPQWLDVTSALATALNASVILGINLEADNQKLAGAEARTLVSGIGGSRVQALELGNEPELYHSFGWYRNAAGLEVPGRSAAWSFSRYTRDFSTVGGALPRLPLAGPAIGAPGWLRDTRSFVAAQPRVRIVTVHRYPLQQCGMPAASPKYPSVANILSPAASAGLADSVVPYVADAHAHGDAIRVDEINTVSCGGAAGVSNAFVSALWTVDALFEMARVGVDGVNVHTYRGATYELFTFQDVNGAWTAHVAPQYYGMLLFARAAPPGSRLERVAGTGGPIRAWATRARDGRTRVVLINDDTGHGRIAAVRAPGTGGAASLERLLAPGVHATTGVTLGGQSFGAATSTGLLAGASRIASVSASRGEYRVALPAASAALLTLPRR
jgi:Glycosyl hydrolase family 79 C-terminal beta domain